MDLLGSSVAPSPPRRSHQTGVLERVMTERQLTFIDADENRLVLWLKEDRVQLCVVDSRPELEAGQLRAFASALFAAYVGGPLVARLLSARGAIGKVRDQLAEARAGDELLAALDGSLCAIESVKDALDGRGVLRSIC